ncbi:MAG TPA: glycosyltransferase family 4 protein [Leptospiraceae bacterium]|nr:glycosyltransferase family 4 protein [Leptospiraceae bacterium]HMW07053.1 glycosyltransferase family 4 protein [Leptospiraceae bacterium]HMX32750.1 glycosyltransferase family 4 protein [Leptospiraceae bacterium]HMY33858.1 glycosyltransferase family 4 protein [Leptospiraceae bacterium]HMZ66812.1 glycosyltransferase family 4 protein [Leptospiraceae bacterium]
MKKKIALISPIFSPNISGGAERHAISFAELLSEDYDLEILTTKALDYITWKNVIKEDTETFHASLVRRFKVKETRNIKSFNRYHARLIHKLPNISEKEMEKWIQKQGPYCPDLIHFIRENQHKYDVFIFMTYLYYTTIYGMSEIKNKSICVTTLHDEPPAYFPIYKKILTNEISYSFNTPEERDLFVKIFSYKPKHYSIIGLHVDQPAIVHLPKPKGNYVVYIGRIDAGKGIYTLIEKFLEWRNKYNEEIDLVLIGGGEQVLASEHVRFTGYISEEEKINYLKNALFLINPSHLESFSIVVMEAWLLEIPVLVNAESEILKAHCIRSNAGLYYSDQENFEATFNYLLDHPETRKKMGRNGRLYVEMNYTRDKVKQKLLSLVESIKKRDSAKT